MKKLYALYRDRGFDVVGVNLDGDRKALEERLRTTVPPDRGNPRTGDAGDDRESA